MMVHACVPIPVYIASHIETMPHNGRHRVMLLSPKYEEKLGEHAYREILSSSQLLPSSHPVSHMTLFVKWVQNNVAISCVVV